MKKFCLGIAMCLTVAVSMSAFAAGATGKAKVAFYVDRGPGGIGAAELLRMVEESPEMELHLVDGADVKSGKLAGMDLLLMPGGSSKWEHASLGADGEAKVKEFISGGGAYMGICAGCALVMDEKSRARMIPWRWSGAVTSSLNPTIQLNEKGAAALGLKAGPRVIRYHGGPFMWPGTNVMADVKTESWATFDAEASMKGKLKVKMYGATAMVGGTLGKGRIFVSTVHPEYNKSTLPIVKAAFRYLLGRDVTFPARSRSPRSLAVGFIVAGMTGKDIASTILAIDAEKGMDLVPVAAAEIDRRILEHVDVLVIGNDHAAKNNIVKNGIREFAAHGGKVIGFSSGAKMLPKGGVPCRDGKEALAALRKEIQ